MVINGEANATLVGNYFEWLFAQNLLTKLYNHYAHLPFCWTSRQIIKDKSSGKQLQRTTGKKISRVESPASKWLARITCSAHDAKSTTSTLVWDGTIWLLAFEEHRGSWWDNLCSIQSELRILKLVSWEGLSIDIVFLGAMKRDEVGVRWKFSTFVQWLLFPYHSFQRSTLEAIAMHQVQLN